MSNPTRAITLRGFSVFTAIACRRFRVVALAISLAIPVVAAQTVPASAQDTERREVDLSADLISSDVVDGRRINRLVGNVVLADDSTTLRAYRATEYTDRDLIIFSGNVSVVEAGDTLKSDMLRYERRTKIGEASGRVELSDGDVRVYGPVARYHADERHTVFRDGVTLVDSSATLTARLGDYWSREKRALFREDVTLVDERSTTTADSIEYFRESEVAEARGNVVVSDERAGARRDTLSETWLFSNHVRAERREDRVSAFGNVLLLRVTADSADAETDTLAVRSARLTSHESDSLETLIAVGGVTIWSNTVAALADSLHSVRVTAPGDTTGAETVSLFRSPVLWYDETQITGDTITVRLRDGEVDSLFVDGSAFLAQEDTVLSQIQQVAGATLRGRFTDGDGEIVVGPGANAVYFIESDGEPGGAMRVASSYVTFVFAGDSLQAMRWAVDIDGTYYDEEIVPPSLGLDGLRWRPGERPLRGMWNAEGGRWDVVRGTWNVGRGTWDVERGTGNRQRMPPTPP